MGTSYNFQMDLRGSRNEIYKVWRNLRKLEYFENVVYEKPYYSSKKNGEYVIHLKGYCKRYFIGLNEQEIKECFNNTEVTSNIVMYCWENFDRLEIEIDEFQQFHYSYLSFYDVVNSRYSKNGWNKFVCSLLNTNYYELEETIESNYKELFENSFNDDGTIDPYGWYLLMIELYGIISDTE